MRLFLLTSLAVALMTTAAAQAQSGPSFDCAKASNVVERAVCKDADLAKADRELASLYTALLGRLTGPAKESLEKNQVSWIVSRNRSCGASEPDMTTYCLKKRYEERIADLKASGTGTYPFVEAQTIEKKGKVGKVSYSIDILYPRFAGKTADFSAVNKVYADNAAKAARETTPTSDPGVDRPQEWSAMGSYALYRPGPDAITVALDFWSYTGGAHGYGAITCKLVDLRSGKAVAPEAVFAPGDQWLKELVTLTAADLKKQFVEESRLRRCLEAREPHQASARRQPLLLAGRQAAALLQCLRSRALRRGCLHRRHSLCAAAAASARRRACRSLIAGGAPLQRRDHDRATGVARTQQLVQFAPVAGRGQ